MGREIRRVPEGWEHPRDKHGNHEPLLDGGFEKAANEWVENCRLWSEGVHPSQQKGEDRPTYFWEWDGEPPVREHYREEFAEPATHYQVYETVSEGTPTSPVFATRDDLRAWLVSEGYSPEAAANFAEGGYAPSMIISGGKIYSDIESCGDV